MLNFGDVKEEIIKITYNKYEIELEKVLTAEHVDNIQKMQLKTRDKLMKYLKLKKTQDNIDVDFSNVDVEDFASVMKHNPNEEYAKVLFSKDEISEIERHFDKFGAKASIYLKEFYNSIGMTVINAISSSNSENKTDTPR